MNFKNRITIFRATKRTKRGQCIASFHQRLMIAKPTEKLGNEMCLHLYDMPCSLFHVTSKQMDWERLEATASYEWNLSLHNTPRDLARRHLKDTNFTGVKWYTWYHDTCVSMMGMGHKGYGEQPWTTTQSTPEHNAQLSPQKKMHGPQ
jgi:hypothetical protein